jgi:hypothetical protein
MKDREGFDSTMSVIEVEACGLYATVNATSMNIARVCDFDKFTLCICSAAPVSVPGSTIS